MVPSFGSLIAHETSDASARPMFLASTAMQGGPRLPSVMVMIAREMPARTRGPLNSQEATCHPSERRAAARPTSAMTSVVMSRAVGSPSTLPESTDLGRSHVRVSLTLRRSTYSWPGAEGLESSLTVGEDFIPIIPRWLNIELTQQEPQHLLEGNAPAGNMKAVQGATLTLPSADVNVAIRTVLGGVPVPSEELAGLRIRHQHRVGVLICLHLPLAFVVWIRLEVEALSGGQEDGRLAAALESNPLRIRRQSERVAPSVWPGTRYEVRRSTDAAQRELQEPNVPVSSLALTPGGNSHPREWRTQ